FQFDDILAIRADHSKDIQQARDAFSSLQQQYTDGKIKLSEIGLALEPILGKLKANPALLELHTALTDFKSYIEKTAKETATPQKVMRPRPPIPKAAAHVAPNEAAAHSRKEDIEYEVIYQ